VEELPIEFVKQFQGNALWKSAEQMKEFEADIRANGFEHPVTLIVGRYNKEVFLGEGNHRLAIAEQMGLDTIPTMIGLYQNAYNLINEDYPPKYYPFINPQIEDLDFETNRPSDVFTKIIW
jgi:hypothetical protein